MKITLLARLGRWLLGPFLWLVVAGLVQAGPVLTAAASGAGFGLSQFADNFPTTGFCCGPLGIAFVDGGGVMVSDYPGNVRVFGSHADGQHANLVAASQSYGNGNAVGLARLGSYVYMAQQSSGNVVRLNQDGTYHSAVVSGIPSATGIVANLVTGKLYVSDCCSNTGIWEVDPVSNTKTQFKGFGSYDGMSISADGSTIYAELGSHIIGYRLSDGVQVFDSGFIPGGADGTELGAGTLAGQIFVNTNSGDLWQISLVDPTLQLLLVTGGSRGDFVTADPDGSLLFTQTSDIWRLTAPEGGCIGRDCGGGDVPEPGSLPLVGLAMCCLLGLGRRASRH
ncbi:hypothetical protein J7U46_18530 [Pelomonas sp. V22]|uniref:YncE family protein n=1 Tax=Pelomonas sp. V22 TaxID=2822139 RepID=UPI0024A9A2E1|nr:PEP-CTERM sorting domain-containing protein [Pelomonas sp. V22]MDI4635066.1 hypothetical protein [Pelomonas sp. V22]